MNIDYIRAKCKMLHGTTPQERNEIFKNIGICVGLISTKQIDLSPQKLDEVYKWLQANAEKLRLDISKVPTNGKEVFISGKNNIDLK